MTTTLISQPAGAAVSWASGSERPNSVPRTLPGRVEHIFIVGVSRSGTTLMRRVLERSPEVAIGRESHFLGHLLDSEGARQKLRRFGDLCVDANVVRLVDFVYSGGLGRSSRLREASSQWTWLTRHVPASDFQARLLASDRSERAVFDALLDSYAEHKGRRVRGDKTPAHVRYVATLMDWYPDARVVHLVRDPRAIYVSEVRRRGREHDSHPYRELAVVPPLLRLFVLLETTFAWADSSRRARSNLRRYPAGYIVLRFEDLVAEPERVIRDLCERCGIAFDGGMLDQEVVSDGWSAGLPGFDSAAGGRWQKEIGTLPRRWFDLVFGRPMAELGYGR